MIYVEAAFWSNAPCNIAEIDKRFRGAYCLHHQGAVMMEVENISETPVKVYQKSRHINPESIQLHTCCCENLKSQLFF
jgi:hypothetical protein